MSSEKPETTHTDRIDAVGDLMKHYESQYSEQRLLVGMPVIARMDGKAFHTFTKGLERPYDPELSQTMMDTASALVKEFNADLGYVQSDEISLIWLNNSLEQGFLYDGRVQKFSTILAATTSVIFNKLLLDSIPSHAGMNPVFDARLHIVPNLEVAADYFMWREADAMKNSISMAASTYFSPSELHGKNSKERRALLETRDVVWGEYPAFFKKGTYFKLVTESRKFEAHELEKLPPMHAARRDPELEVTRRVMTSPDFPVLSRISNKADVLFKGAEPISTPANPVQ